MGKLKQLHIDCTPEQCENPDPNSSVCPLLWAQDHDTEPTEPGEPVDGSDRDPNIDMDRE